MSLKKDQQFIKEVEYREGMSSIFLLQEIVDTTIGRKAFEAFGVQYPVEFLVWCFTLNDDMPTHLGYVPAEALGSPEVLLAASIERARRAAK